MPLGTLLSALSLSIPVGEDPPVELGLVRWRTDHDRAFEEAKRAGKPLVLFFQEVPG